MDRLVTMAMDKPLPLQCVITCFVAVTVSRPLTDFECPYISLQVINKTSTHRIVIRKR